MYQSTNSGFAALGTCPKAERVALQNREMDFAIAGRSNNFLMAHKGWEVKGKGDNRYFFHPQKGTLTRCKYEPRWIATDLDGNRKSGTEFFPYMASYKLDR